MAPISTGRLGTRATFRIAAAESTAPGRPYRGRAGGRDLWPLAAVTWARAG